MWNFLNFTNPMLNHIAQKYKGMLINIETKLSMTKNNSISREIRKINK